MRVNIIQISLYWASGTAPPYELSLLRVVCKQNYVYMHMWEGGAEGHPPTFAEASADRSEGAYKENT